EGNACVKQRDGSFRTVRSDVELGPRAAGPLARGQVAFLRGLEEGDVSAEGSPPAHTSTAARSIRVMVIDETGKERAFAPPIPVRGYLRVLSPIEEDADKALHFLLGDQDEALSFIVQEGRESGAPLRLVGVREGRLRAGVGMAVTDRQMMATVDGGA